MEKLICFLLICIIISCSPNKMPGADKNSDNRFPTEQFELTEYNKKVATFLENNLSEKELESTNRVVFLNTRSCASCTMGAFEAIAPYLERTEVSHIIFINDSAIAESQPERKNVTFKYFRRESSKKQEFSTENHICTQ